MNRFDPEILDPYKNVDFDIVEEVSIDELSETLFRCLEYWHALPSTGFAPSWKSVDLPALPGNALPLVTVIDVEWPAFGPLDETHMRYRFWGTGHVNAKGIERTGETVAGHAHGRSAVVASEYVKVVECQEPMAFVKCIRVSEPWRAVRQATLRMPLSNDGTRVDHVFSVSEWSPI